MNIRELTACAEDLSLLGMATTNQREMREKFEDLVDRESWPVEGLLGSVRPVNVIPVDKVRDLFWGNDEGGEG